MAWYLGVSTPVVRIETFLYLTNGALKDLGYCMPSFFPYGKAGGLQILRWQVFAVKYYGFTLAALTLEPSDFCNNGVYTHFTAAIKEKP
jgi:hypothetical protein